MAKRPSKRQGGEAESFLFGLLSQSVEGLAETCNSGAKHGNKDFGTSRLLIEAKSTKHSSFSVTKALLEEIEDAALRLGKDAVLAVLMDAAKPTSFSEDNAFLVLPMDFGTKLLRFYYGASREEGS